MNEDHENDGNVRENGDRNSRFLNLKTILFLLLVIGFWLLICGVICEVFFYGIGTATDILCVILWVAAVAIVILASG